MCASMIWFSLKKKKPSAVTFQPWILQQEDAISRAKTMATRSTHRPSQVTGKSTSSISTTPAMKVFRSPFPAPFTFVKATNNHAKGSSIKLGQYSVRSSTPKPAGAPLIPPTSSTFTWKASGNTKATRCSTSRPETADPVPCWWIFWPRSV